MNESRRDINLIDRICICYQRIKYASIHNMQIKDISNEKKSIFRYVNDAVIRNSLTWIILDSQIEAGIKADCNDIW